MRFIFPNLLLAALLFAPTAAHAQVPSVGKTTRTVTIQMAFVPADKADLDELGIRFYPLPLVTPAHASLTYSADKIVSQLYQTLTRTQDKAMLIGSVAAIDNQSCTIAVEAKAPAYYSPAFAFSGIMGPSPSPKLLGYFQIQGKLTLTPHITPGNWVKLAIAANGSGKPVRLGAVPSGGSIVIVAPNIKSTRTPILGSLFRSSDTLPDTQELLMFITPTILSARGDAGNITVNP